MFQDFPSLHPLVVHFPIVLILLAAAFQAAVVWKSWNQIRWATLFIMAGAFLSALAASTVFHAEPSADAPKAAMEMFEQHEHYAQLTLWMSGITLLLKSIGMFFKIDRRLYEVIVLVAAIITAVFLSITGHHGAKVTHIAGVGPMGRYLMEGHEHGAGEMDGMDMRDSVHHDGANTDSMNNPHDMKGMDDTHGKDGGHDDKAAHDMKNMGDMKGKEAGHDMKNMGDMKDKAAGHDMKNMDNMKGKETGHDMKNMGDMKDKSGGHDMKNMDNMKGKEAGHDMKNMGDMKGKEGAHDMKNMGDMNMPTSAMDTIRFPDNNPARKKSKHPNKQ